MSRFRTAITPVFLIILMAGACHRPAGPPADRPPAPTVVPSHETGQVPAPPVDAAPGVRP